MSEPHSSSQEEQTLNTESFEQLSSSQGQWQRTQSGALGLRVYSAADLNPRPLWYQN